MAIHALDSALQRALSEYLQTDIHGRLFVGVSGGIDSVALLFACKRWLQSQVHKQIELQAIHVNHGLSPYAEQWQQHVIQICESWSIPLSVQKVDVSSEGSLEEAAREARYRVFKNILKDQDILLLGHHQDDQIETMMQRLMRGSGLSGLLSMNAKRALLLHNDEQATVLRPFLSLSKKYIEDYAERCDLHYVNDDSNQDDRFDRNFWRLNVLPLIGKRYPQYRQSVQASLDALQQEQSALQFFLQQAVEKVLAPNATINLQSLRQYPTAIQQQVLRHWLQLNGLFPLPTQRQLNTILTEVVEAREDADPRFEWHEYVLTRFNEHLYLLDASLTDIEHGALPSTWQGEVVDLGFAVLKQIQIEGIGLIPDQYQVVWGNPGQTIRPVGRPSKSYKKLMQEAQIPPWYRSHWPVLLKHGQVAALPGICVCEGFSQPLGWQIELDFKLNKK